VSDTYERWHEWTDRARAVVLCADKHCTPERHIASIRYLLCEAYDKGLLDGLRDARERDENLWKHS
jgi:hypothetical protein